MVRSLSVVVLLCSVTLGLGQRKEPPRSPFPQDQTNAAMRLATQGKIAEAVELVRKHVKKYPEDPNGYGLIGQFLAFDGQTEEAIKAWTEGATKSSNKYVMWMLVARTREQQAADGPNIIRRRGTITALPGKDKAAEKKFREQRYRDAVEAFKSASSLNPKELEPVEGMARAYSRLGQYQDAVKSWKTVVDRDKKSIGGWLGLGGAQLAAKDAEAARASISKALEINPRSVAALSSMVKLCEATKKKDDATKYKEQLNFYQKLPPFTTIEFKSETVAIVDKLNDMERVVALAKQGTDEAHQLLAALCWQHPHNKNEDYAFVALDKAGPSTSPILRDLIRHARSTCTIRGAGHILARRKDPQAFDLLMPQLFQDVRFGFEMNIAGALDNLGDPRAVQGLITMMSPNDRNRNTGNVAFVQDRFGARARATLALGAFDVPLARKALQEASENPSLAPFAYAALYRMGKAKDTKQLEKMLVSLKALDSEQKQTAKPKQNVLVVGEALKATPNATRIRKYLEAKADTEMTRAFLAKWKTGG